MIRGDVGPSEPLGLFGFVSTIRETGFTNCEGAFWKGEKGMTKSCVVEKYFLNLNLLFCLVLLLDRTGR